MKRVLAVFFALLLPFSVHSQNVDFGFSAPPVSSASIVSGLGYTPVNKAGDTAIGTLQLSSASTFNWNADTYLLRESANTLSQRNGTNAQSHLVYNTYTDASNYERGTFSWGSNILSIGAIWAGTGTPRTTRLMSGSTYIDIDGSSGSVNFHRDASSAATLVQFNSSGITSTSALVAKFNPSINQASGTYSIIDINPTETAIGAGPHYLIGGRLGGGAVASVFGIQNNGAMNISGDFVQTNGAHNYVAAGGTADAQTLTYSPAVTAYKTGATYVFKAVGTNTVTTPTLNINGLGTKTMVKRASTALAAGDIVSGGFYHAVYNGTNMQILNPTVP